MYMCVYVCVGAGAGAGAGGHHDQKKSTCGCTAETLRREAVRAASITCPRSSSRRTCEARHRGGRQRQAGKNRRADEAALLSPSPLPLSLNLPSTLLPLAHQCLCRAARRVLGCRALRLSE
jgi:hypothetical protein